MNEALLAERENRGVAAEGSLVEAAIGGDVEAFGALYDQQVDRVYRHLYYLTGNQTDAEDLTQQVFMQAWRAISRYRRTGASFRTWLFTIAHNLAMSHFRRAKETMPIDLDLPEGSRWANPEDTALTRYDRMAVRRAVLHLKDDQRQVIVLRFIEHLDYAEIAAALGKSQGNVRVIQHRALTELRKLLEREVEL